MMFSKNPRPSLAARAHRAAAALVFSVFVLSCSPKADEREDEAPSYPIPEGMELVWSDEFDYDGAPDPEKWSYSLGLNGWGNDEIQLYTDSRDNSWAKDGKLFVAAVNSDGTWTSARLKSRSPAEWTCGYFEVRARLAEGQGVASSLWMLPRQDIYGRWPRSGEIVIAESAGSGEAYHAAYTEALGEKGARKAAAPPGEGLASGFHTYGLEWDEGFIRWLVDGEETFRIEKSGETPAEWPFDIPFYIIINVAVGGSRAAGQNVDGSIKAAVMEVDYARVYQRL